MFGTLESLKTKAIDAALAAACPALSTEIQRYASLSLRWASKNQCVVAELTPVGEVFTIEVRIAALTIAPDGSFVRLTGLACDRVWAHNLLRDFVEGQKFAVPTEHRGKLALLSKVPGFGCGL